MMKYQFQLTNIDEIDAELTIKMKMSDWKDLNNQLSQIKVHPTCRLHTAIFEMIHKAKETFYGLKEDRKP